MHTANPSPTHETASTRTSGPLRVAIVGGGWAGLAAAVRATQAGHQVSVFEAAHQWGGRARTVTLPWPDGEGGTQPLDLDNGQHILIGAYSATFDLMRSVGADPAHAFVRLPLTLRFADGGGLALPDWPRPPMPGLDAAWGMLRAKGWRWADKLGLLRASLRWQAMGYQCPPSWSVARLCQGLSPQLMSEFIEPLCVSALNTLPHEASGQVFLRVLHDSLMGPGDEASHASDTQGGPASPHAPSGRIAPSNLMLPRQAMGALWCEHAARWLAERGAQLHLGQAVQGLQAVPASASAPASAPASSESAPNEPALIWHLHTSTAHAPGSASPPAAFDRVLIATNAAPAARLLGQLDLRQLPQPAQASLQAELQHWCTLAEGLRWEAISTVYARVKGPAQPGRHAPGLNPSKANEQVYAHTCAEKQAVTQAYHLPLAMLALRANAAHPAQFVFERDQLHGTLADAHVDARRGGGRHAAQPDAARHARASAQPPARTHALAFVVSASRLDRATLAQAVTAQALAELGLHVEVQHVLTDKRATFCCTPGLQRPPMAIAPHSAPGLLACGDHIDGPYPATLEGAVRSAEAAVAALRPG